VDDNRQLQVSRIIDAPPGRIFAVLADPARHRELDGAGMLRGLDSGDAPVTAAGQAFVMNMNQDGIGDYQMRSEIVVYEADRRIGWAPAIHPPGALARIGVPPRDRNKTLTALAGAESAFAGRSLCSPESRVRQSHRTSGYLKLSRTCDGSRHPEARQVTEGPAVVAAVPGVSPWRARARVALASQGWSISRRLPAAEAIACRSVSSELTTRS
jgi:hypothetical protein